MALIASVMLPLGTIAPDFTLYDTISQKNFSLSQINNNNKNNNKTIGTVIMFIANHCPFVQHIRYRLIEIAEIYQKLNIQFIAISANDVTQYPEDSPEKMAELGKKLGFPFPYLYDESQEIAKAYQAACTPDFYLFNGQLSCVYRGQFDSATPQNNIPVTGNRLSLALDALLLDRPIDVLQLPSIGCNVKYKNK